MTANTKKIRIVVGQLNFLVGDIKGNADKIIEQARLAQTQYQADLFILSELALTGYPPEDLLLRNDFHQQVSEALTRICQHALTLDIVIGYPHKIGTTIYNAAAHLHAGKIIANYHKQYLPNYGVFDEKRYFTPGEQPCVIECKGIRLGLVICEDLWYPEPAKLAKQAGAEIIICLNASPFDLQKEKSRVNIIHQRIRETQLGVIYAHGIGGQDEVVFDGGSMAVDAHGELCCQAPYFQEALLPIELTLNHSQLVITKQELSALLSEETLAYQALVQGVKDYIEKNRFPGAIIGLSGGIDSALTLAIAVDALGADRVHAVSLPSRYTSKLSIDLAEEMAKLLNVKFSVISIEPVFNAFLQGLQAEFTNLPVDQTEENIQARCRGTILMALSNKTGKLVLTTGNKSEMAVGYATLYGDMAGGFAVLKDVFKTLVFRLAHYRNLQSYVIPQTIIDRPPTAELKENQLDEDTLPPYPMLDKILHFYVELDYSVSDIVAVGFDEATVLRVTKMVDRNEYKRRQAPPGIRITQRAFGRERRYPITSGFKHN